MAFLHACGHKPLAGYTIKRGISAGGFGEVYFGLTDGGKEVALKRIIRHQDIELRGIRNCLNLKHPHLVHLYDLKTDDRGESWLVMEYIRGETLQAILQRHPHGLPHDMIRPWFAQLAAAIHSLHEQGIVHRDLKPANIFIENGMVKVGDYGLCKFIGGSQHRSQTNNVGTVHYMAPEIGKGDYSRPIDVYAAGIILFEMLTGRPPFDGETAAEILFKHLSSTPDLSATGPFAPIIAKATAKAPGERFASLAEMARRVGQTDDAIPISAPPPTLAMASVPMLSTNAASTLVIEQPKEPWPMARRLTIAGLVCIALAVVVAGVFTDGEWSRMISAFVLSIVASSSVIVFSRRDSGRLDDSLLRRAAFGFIGMALGLLAVWLDGYSLMAADGQGPWSPRIDSSPRTMFLGALYPNNQTLSVAVGQVAYFGLMFSILRWWMLASPRRPFRLGWTDLLAVAFWAYVLLFLLPTSEERLTGFWTATLTAIAVQAASPRRDPDPVPSKRIRLRWA